MSRDGAPNTAIPVNVILWDQQGSPVTGLAAGAVTVTYARPDGTTGTAAKTGWTEILSGKGVYRFTFSAAELGTNAGEFIWLAEATGATAYPGLLQLEDGGPSPRIATALIAIRDGDLHVRIYANKNGLLDSTGTSGKVTVYNEDGTTAIAEQTDASADAVGMFNVVVSPHTLSQKTNYSMKVVVETPTGTVQSHQGFSTT